MRRGKGKKATGDADSAPIPEWAGPMNASHVDEVEELLRVAQDDIFLRLNVNSHRLHSSSSSCGLDADLGRRFAALKVPSAEKPNSPAACNGTEKKRGQVGDGESDDVLDAELSARFLALKGSMKGEANVPLEQPVDSFSVAAGDGCGEDEDFDSEVQKLLQWAKDAARLDPSRSDEEEGNGSDGDDNCSDEDDDENYDDRVCSWKAGVSIMCQFFPDGGNHVYGEECLSINCSEEGAFSFKQIMLGAVTSGSFEVSQLKTGKCLLVDGHE